MSTTDGSVPRRTRRSRSALLVVALAVMCALLTGPVPAQAASGVYIVVLRPGVSLQAHLKAMKITPNRTYSSALGGYAVTLNSTQYQRLLGNADVIGLTPDQSVLLGPGIIQPPPDVQPAQVPSNGITRVGGLASPTAKIDGVDDEMSVDIAIIDSGIDLNHPDLDVRGGVDCTSSTKTFDDVQGHGTFVAGFAAAIDNAIGRVGVAPGARLWSVRVGNKAGSLNLSSVLCAVDWVTATRMDADLTNDIEVANMSLGFKASQGDTGNCGYAKNKGQADPLHQAICASVAAGVTYVVSAGNEGIDAQSVVPAAYDEVITVSAMADKDGQPGGLGGALTCDPSQTDDTFATFSNFGADVDLSAPGVCIGSTVPDDNYFVGSGTSFSAPIVAGAAALYLLTHPSATPADVKAALLAAAEPGPITGDPDTYPEGIVNVSSF